MKYSTSISTLAIALITTIITTSAVTALENTKTKRVPGSLSVKNSPGQVFKNKILKGTLDASKVKKRNGNKTSKATK
jgi:hypothetical protein